ncbi:MAG: hypothetical protein OXD33_12530 [Rhodobacteraceae bacterium]|nr:hypothetical protein [Paracoccaceae bacterium]MCY4328397.1 hypothetical protein [Paracoccaceae bacterium]
MKLDSLLFKFLEIPNSEPINTHGTRRPVNPFTRIPLSWTIGPAIDSTILQRMKISNAPKTPITATRGYRGGHAKA